MVTKKIAKRRRPKRAAEVNSFLQAAAVQAAIVQAAQDAIAKAAAKGVGVDGRHLDAQQDQPIAVGQGRIAPTSEGAKVPTREVEGKDKGSATMVAADFATALGSGADYSTTPSQSDNQGRVSFPTVKGGGSHATIARDIAARPEQEGSGAINQKQPQQSKQGRESALGGERHARWGDGRSFRDALQGVVAQPMHSAFVTNTTAPNSVVKVSFELFHRHMKLQIFDSWQGCSCKG